MRTQVCAHARIQVTHAHVKCENTTGKKRKKTKRLFMYPLGRYGDGQHAVFPCESEGESRDSHSRTRMHAFLMHACTHLLASQHRLRNHGLHLSRDVHTEYATDTADHTSMHASCTTIHPSTSTPTHPHPHVPAHAHASSCVPGGLPPPFRVGACGGALD